MSEPRVEHVLCKLMRKFAITEESPILAPPGSGMDLVDRDGRIETIAGGTVLHPVGVAPVVVERPRTRRGCRRALCADRERIGFFADLAGVRFDAVLVSMALPHVRNQSLPYSGRIGAHAERIFCRKPAVPVTNHGYRTRIRRPDGKARATDGIQVTAQAAVQTSVGAFRKIVDVAFGYHGFSCVIWSGRQWHRMTEGSWNRKIKRNPRVVSTVAAENKFRKFESFTIRPIQCLD